MTPTANSYFSGAGLMDLGLYYGGVNVQQSFEIDRDCCATLAANLPHQVVECDITQKLVEHDKECDVMVATYPCTRYSTIADIHKVRTGDVMFLHFLRHLSVRKPEVYVVENVPGMKKFPVEMETITKIKDYYVHVVCPVQTQAWLPQRRDRLIVIGSLKPFSWRKPEPTKRLKLRDILEPDPQLEIPACVYNRLNGQYRDRPIISCPERDDIAPTCVAHYAKDMGTRLVADKRFPGGARPYTVREYARLQGVPDLYQFKGGNCAAYRQIGNGVSVPVGQWLGEEICRYFAA